MVALCETIGREYNLYSLTIGDQIEVDGLFTKLCDEKVTLVVEEITTTYIEMQGYYFSVPIGTFTLDLVDYLESGGDDEI